MLLLIVVLGLVWRGAAPALAEPPFKGSGLVKSVPGQRAEESDPADETPPVYLLANPADKSVYVLSGKAVEGLEELIDHRVEIEGKLLPPEEGAPSYGGYSVVEVRRVKPLLDLYVRPSRKQVKLGENLEIKLSLENNTGRKKKFHFSKGRRYDLIVHDAAGSEVYRFGRSNMVLTTKERTTLKDGQRTDFEVIIPVDSRLFKNGEDYSLTGYVFIENEPPITAASSFRVKWIYEP